MAIKVGRGQLGNKKSRVGEKHDGWVQVKEKDDLMQQKKKAENRDR